MTAAARGVRRELRHGAASQTAFRFDGAADRRVALGVKGVHSLEPVRWGLHSLGQERVRAGSVSRQHVDGLLVRRVAELGEPEAVLLYEVDGESVATRRNRRAERELLVKRLARGHSTLERGNPIVWDGQW